MKLYIANQTCSQAVQIIANELGLDLDLVHFYVFDRTTSDGSDFAAVNPLLYVPVLALESGGDARLTETITILSYLADTHPEAGLIPAAGTLDRAKFDQLLTFTATEIAQKHIPLMRRLMTDEGSAWTCNKLIKAYTVLNDRLAQAPFIAGSRYTVSDAYVWTTMWHERSGTDISHLDNLATWKQRMDGRPVVKALREEAAMAAEHKTIKTA